MASTTGSNSPNLANSEQITDKGKGKSKEQPLTASITNGGGSNNSTSSTSKAKKDAPPPRESGIVLSPAMVQQMHNIIENHAVLKRDADNNVPFTNHLLDLIPVPSEFSSSHIENTAQATSYINSEASKIRMHLAVVQQTKDGVADPDAKKRLEKEVEALDNHIMMVKDFMRMSFHSALSGNPVSQTSFGSRDPPASMRKPPVMSEISRSSAMVSPVVPASTPLTPHVLGAKQKTTSVNSGMATPVTNPNSTHVALSSALAH
ncbi:hypothetical protein LPJ66_009757, partial [Kickxella alabastrina]